MVAVLPGWGLDGEEPLAVDVGVRDPVVSVGLGREVSPGVVDVAGFDSAAEGF